MRLLEEFGACDCHSHVYGPFSSFPLSPQRNFDPPEAPIGELQLIWASIGIDRAVLVQGSAHGDDHTALLGALQRAPETRRGVALLTHTVADTQLAAFHRKGIRAVRLNWISHLLGTRPRSEAQTLTEASALSERIAPLGWHIEIHIDAADLKLLGRLEVPDGMQVVIDHMARIDLSGPESEAQLNCLGELLENPVFWVKLSGADRLAERCDDLRVALNGMRAILRFAPDRCVWGLDWPHVNLPKKRTDLALAELLFETVEDDSTLRKVLIENPARLYDFAEPAP
jgi:2-pyrone-4,6-dicarboxylate lactonase